MTRVPLYTAVVSGELTGTEWDGFTVEAFDRGVPREGIEEIPATLSYGCVWKAFYPEAQLFQR